MHRLHFRMQQDNEEEMSLEQDLKVLDEMTNQLVCQVRSSVSDDRTALSALSDSFVSVQQSALETRQALKENIRGGLKFLCSV